MTDFAAMLKVDAQMRASSFCSCKNHGDFSMCFLVSKLAIQTFRAVIRILAIMQYESSGKYLEILREKIYKRSSLTYIVPFDVPFTVILWFAYMWTKVDLPKQYLGIKTAIR